MWDSTLLGGSSGDIDQWLEPRSRQTKEYEIVICGFTTKYASLKRKCKEWLPLDQDNVSEWSDISTPV